MTVITGLPSDIIQLRRHVATLDVPDAPFPAYWSGRDVHTAMLASFGQPRPGIDVIGWTVVRDERNRWRVTITARRDEWHIPVLFRGDAADPDTALRVALGIMLVAICDEPVTQLCDTEGGRRA